MKELIGFEIKSIEVLGEYQNRILFTVETSDWHSFDTGKVCYYAEGDCCSHTYFSDVINYKNIIDKEVVRIEEVELIEGDYNARPSRQEVDTVYGYKLYSKDGDSCLIVFRNSSNGYYGGWCSLESIQIGESQHQGERSITIDDNNWSAPQL